MVFVAISTNSFSVDRSNFGFIFLEIYTVESVLKKLPFTSIENKCPSFQLSYALISRYFLENMCRFLELFFQKLFFFFMFFFHIFFSAKVSLHWKKLRQNNTINQRLLLTWDSDIKRLAILHKYVTQRDENCYDFSGRSKNRNNLNYWEISARGVLKKMRSFCSLNQQCWFPSSLAAD